MAQWPYAGSVGAYEKEPAENYSFFLQAVKRFMALECKCHGVSGSCTVRTCWQSMQEFRLMAKHLRMRYNGATQVTMNQEGTDLMVARPDHKRPTKSDLVYLEESPDYCVHDPETGKSTERLAVTSVS